MFAKFYSFVTLTLVLSLSSLSAHASLLMADVGDLDQLVASTTLANSGDAVELQWVQSVLGTDVILSEKYDTVASAWTKVEDAANDYVYATELVSDPEYYLLKLGTGGTQLESHFIFQNLGDTSWAAIDFPAAGIDLSVRKINLGRLSHVGEFGSIGEIHVPEPETLAILAIGLLGLSARRFRKS